MDRRPVAFLTALILLASARSARGQEADDDPDPGPAIETLTTSPAADVRRDALEALLGLPTAARIDALRRLAGPALYPDEAAGDAVLEGLLDQLGSDEFETREEATRRLAAMGAAIVERLRSALAEATGKDEEVAWRLRRLLADAGGEASSGRRRSALGVLVPVGGVDVDLALHLVEAEDDALAALADLALRWRVDRWPPAPPGAASLRRALPTAESWRRALAPRPDGGPADPGAGITLADDPVERLRGRGARVRSRAEVAFDVRNETGGDEAPRRCASVFEESVDGEAVEQRFLERESTDGPWKAAEMAIVGRAVRVPIDVEGRPVLADRGEPIDLFHICRGPALTTLIPGGRWLPGDVRPIDRLPFPVYVSSISEPRPSIFAGRVRYLGPSEGLHRFRTVTVVATAFPEHLSLLWDVGDLLVDGDGAPRRAEFRGFGRVEPVAAGGRATTFWLSLSYSRLR